MKCINKYKKKVKELNEKFVENGKANQKALKQYLEELKKLDNELINEIRSEKNIATYSALYY